MQGPEGTPSTWLRGGMGVRSEAWHPDLGDLGSWRGSAGQAVLGKVGVGVAGSGVKGYVGSATRRVD